ncbi:MAG: glucosamine-6-phosphate deaminase [Verrucomicrobiales bacterium]|nr:glucosamine-6-phosphate deaminase [Verrucomicrobiales bacterium]
MHIHRSIDPRTSGAQAAKSGAEKIREALRLQSTANIIVATGASQFSMLEALLAEPDIAWERITIFHLDEYAGLPIDHPASFRQYLWDRFVKQLPHPPRAFHPLNGEIDAEAECLRVGELISSITIDVAFIGIGENGHIAFNDPPADFETKEPYHVVNLDEACRKQQFGEGWFPTLDSVPRRAISMSVKEILRSRHIICTVPDERKAEAVKNAAEGKVTNLVPASILQTHSSTELFLDEAAAGLLSTVGTDNS